MKILDLTLLLKKLTLIIWKLIYYLEVINTTTEIKTYTIQLEISDKVKLIRKNNGFSPYELLGLLEQIQLDILQQLSGDIKPDIIQRNIIN